MSDRHGGLFLNPLSRTAAGEHGLQNKENGIGSDAVADVSGRSRSRSENEGLGTCALPFIHAEPDMPRC